MTGRFDGAIDLAQIGTPASPASGRSKVYLDSNDVVQRVDSAGVVKVIGPATIGTWSPTITAETGTLTTTSAAGRYLALGDLVIYTVSITITTVGTGANGLRFSIPLNIHSDWVNLGSARESAVTGFMCTVARVSANLAQIYKYDNTTIIGAGRTVRVSGQFEKT